LIRHPQSGEVAIEASLTGFDLDRVFIEEQNFDLGPATR
jgi:hypothetical protein